MTVLNLQVSSSADDVWDTFSGGFTASNQFLTCGQYGGTRYRSAMRFANATIPVDATIDSAVLTVRASSSFGVACLTKLCCLDEDSATAPTTNANWNGRTETSAGVDWDITSVWTASTNYPSVSFPSPIQEVVDRAGWVSGNALVVVWKDDNSPLTEHNWRQVVSYNQSATFAPKLDIEYSTGGGGGGVGSKNGMSAMSGMSGMI